MVDGPNRYRWNRNNPNRYVDLDGRRPYRGSWGGIPTAERIAARALKDKLLTRRIRKDNIAALEFLDASVNALGGPLEYVKDEVVAEVLTTASETLEEVGLLSEGDNLDGLIFGIGCFAAGKNFLKKRRHKGPRRRSFRDLMSPEEAAEYDRYWSRHAPALSRPYDMKRRYNPNGDIRQVTTYDRFGRRHRQYDLLDGRRPAHYHEYRDYGPGTEQGVRSGHIFFDE